MDTTRRQTLALALASAGAALPAGVARAGTGTGPGDNAKARDAVPPPYDERINCAWAAHWPRGIEGQRQADLGDGRFLNPVLSGDHPDPNVLKDGEDYYATFSSFQYYPGVPIWHSRDLVNWTPLTAPLKTVIGTVWALDIAKYKGRYYIYIPALDPGDTKRPIKTWVIHADKMEGPWSEPIDLKVDNLIDPAHVVGEDGHRYLFLNGGNRIRLSDDGLSTAGKLEHVYDGWPIPESYVIEGFALEGPKLMRKDGWFYMFSGEGGTAGPPTSHMVVVARSRSVNGPWENCPHNPIVRTTSRDEPWWSRGHATPVEGPDGKWYMVYHGYENGFRTLGRQMLLEPFEWTADGWPRATGGILATPLKKPGGGQVRPHGQALSGFSPNMWGTKLAFFDPEPEYRTRVQLNGDRLRLAAKGSGPADASPLLFVAGDRSYMVDIDVSVTDGAEAGLLLFYNDKLFCGLGIGPGQFHAYRIGNEEQWPQGAPTKATKTRIRMVNDENVVTFFYDVDGKGWKKERSFEVAGYNHNVADGFLSLRPALYATRGGHAEFSGLRYRGLTRDQIPQV